MTRQRLHLAAAMAMALAAGLVAPQLEAQSSDAAPLFASEEPLALTLEVPLRTLVNRRRQRPEVDGFVRYMSDDGTEVALDVEVRTRGKSRLELCSFPPLSLNFRRRQVENTPFAGQNRLKLVTLCRTNSNFDQYLELEHFVYRAYQTLSEHAFRVRRVRMRYVDTDRDNREVEAPAFFIEHIEGLAARTGMTAAELPAIEPNAHAPGVLAMLGLFQFMIGNTDWSAISAAEGEDCCHNSDVLQPADSTMGLVVVPYDFDQAGLINAPYAEPNEQLGLRSVRQRLYRGLCASNSELDATIAKFDAARPTIEALLASAELDAERRDEALEYLASGYAIINDPDQRQTDIIDRCRG